MKCGAGKQQLLRLNCNSLHNLSEELFVSSWWLINVTV